MTDGTRGHTHLVAHVDAPRDLLRRLLEQIALVHVTRRQVEKLDHGLDLADECVPARVRQCRRRRYRWLYGRRIRCAWRAVGHRGVCGAAEVVGRAPKGSVCYKEACAKGARVPKGGVLARGASGSE
eukprot:965957-Prymnesium_polylepis.1